MKNKNQKKIKEISQTIQTTHNQIKIPQVNTKQLQKELQITKQNLQQKIMTLNQQRHNETTDTKTKLKICDEYKNTKEYLKEITMAYNEIQSINKKLDEITTSLFNTHEAIQKLNLYQYVL
ncbi:hypothetical protein [Methanosphaera cuniculi]|uniref:Uncharacterized protein n=1 Tax=Methanosphaera cuniculi TaxID=1077256 RepID=A0A2A2HEC4_9EURY|nr:hypothetical protein [Methanosphaera cuniculi]PAV07656.1 hypothetical protein ASJ82_08240 [Methanosphaera cuniculi]PWL08018.1 hypothetical protein MSCUN_09490 [Methanosphaera cuniculi]